MFHLATAGRSLTERRDTIAGLWGRGRLLRSYLVGTVLQGLAAQERDFLVRSCALFVLDGPTCDALQVQLEVLLAEELGPDATRAWYRLRNPAPRHRDPRDAGVPAGRARSRGAGAATHRTQRRRRGAAGGGHRDRTGR